MFSLVLEILSLSLHMWHVLAIPSLYTPSPSLHQHCGRSEIPTPKPILLLILVINHSTSWSKLKGNKRQAHFPSRALGCEKRAFVRLTHM